MLDLECRKLDTSIDDEVEVNYRTEENGPHTSSVIAKQTYPDMLGNKFEKNGR